MSHATSPSSSKNGAIVAAFAAAGLFVIYLVTGMGLVGLFAGMAGAFFLAIAPRPDRKPDVLGPNAWETRAPKIAPKTAEAMTNGKGVFFGLLALGALVVIVGRMAGL